MRSSRHRRRGVHRLESGRCSARARRRGDGRRRPLHRPPGQPRRRAGGGRRAGRDRHPRRRRAERPGAASDKPRGGLPPRRPDRRPQVARGPGLRRRRSTSAAPPTCSRPPAPPARGRVVFVSTGGAIYGEGEGQQLPLDESTAIAPLLRLRPEQVRGRGLPGAVRAPLRDLDRMALRLGNVYGPRQDPLGEAGVIAIFCGLLRQRRPADRSSATAPRPVTTYMWATWSPRRWPPPTRRRPARSTSAPAARPACSSWSRPWRGSAGRESFEPEFAPARAGRGAADLDRRRPRRSASWAGSRRPRSRTACALTLDAV